MKTTTTWIRLVLSFFFKSELDYRILSLSRSISITYLTLMIMSVKYIPFLCASTSSFASSEPHMIAMLAEQLSVVFHEFIETMVCLVSSLG
jgi:hypothetical protein